MMGKRVKLRVASACTAVLMVGSMVASSASVFAIIGENNTTQEPNSIRGTNVAPVFNEEVEQWLAELRQLGARFQVVIDEESSRRSQQLASQHTELLRLQAQRNHIISRMIAEPDNQAMVDSLRLVDVQIVGQNSIVQTILRQMQDFNQEISDRGAEIARQYHEFEQETTELIRLQEARENFRLRLEGSLDDMNLANLLRQQELRVSHQEMRVQLRLEYLRNWYNAFFRVLEADTRTETLGTPAE